MAKNDKTTEASTAPVKDRSKYLLDGMSAEDLVRTGGLTPVYNGEYILEERAKGNTVELVAGWIDRIEVLPTMAMGANEEFTPVMVRVRELKFGTFGTRGKRREREIVEVAKGGSIMIPVSGNISVNKELLDALLDLDHVYYGIFECSGTKAVNDMSPMKVWDIDVHYKSKRKREGVYMLSSDYVLGAARGDLARAFKDGEPLPAFQPPPMMQLPNGQYANAQTGELAQ